MIEDLRRAKGDCFITIDYEDGTQEVRHVNNTVVRTAKVAAVNTLTNNFGPAFQYYVDTMIFGTNGLADSEPRVIDDTQNSLFGMTVWTKSVISTVNEAAPTQAIFTCVLAFSEANGYDLNELALVMANGDLYSMITMGSISKTSAQQITFNWRISFI